MLGVLTDFTGNLCNDAASVKDILACYSFLYGGKLVRSFYSMNVVMSLTIEMLA